MHYVDEQGNFTKADGTPLADGEAPVLRPTWKYLLRSKDTGEYVYTYKVTSDMNKMIDNIEHNMQHTSLNEMNTDGLIKTHETLRETAIKEAVIKDTPALKEIFEKHQNPTLGLLTIDQLLTYLELYMQIYK